LFFFSVHGCSNTQLTSTTPDTRISSITGNLDYPNLSDVEGVHIEYATVTFIPDFTLVTRQLPKFKRLWILRSGLKYVERRQLAKLPQLMQLHLDRNLIEDLPEDAFNDLVNLESLIVSANQIKVLPPKLLWNLPKLKIFQAQENHIELIPRDFFKNNRELESIWIHNNKITRIEVDFTLLPKLTALYLNDNTCIDEACYPCKIEKLRQIQQEINRNCTGIV
jgi:Leucine-rich repeat (LRR) protein